METTLKILETADDVTDAILDAALETLDWFDSEPRLNTEEFIDRLCTTYGDGWDIESYDNPAVRKIMRYVRANREQP